jgi:hypothetical protein
MARRGAILLGRLERVPGCEDLSLDLDELWSAVDRLAAGRPQPTDG